MRPGFTDRSRGFRERWSQASRVGPGACAQSSSHPVAATCSANTSVHSPARAGGAARSPLFGATGWSGDARVGSWTRPLQIAGDRRIRVGLSRRLPIGDDLCDAVHLADRRAGLEYFRELATKLLERRRRQEARPRQQRPQRLSQQRGLRPREHFRQPEGGDLRADVGIIRPRCEASIPRRRRAPRPTQFATKSVRTRAYCACFFDRSRRASFARFVRGHMSSSALSTSWRAASSIRRGGMFGATRTRPRWSTQ